MHRQRAFTLIELMIAIAIIAILASIGIPSYVKYITRSKIQEATSSLLGMRVKMEQYYQDNRFYTPPAGSPVLAPCAAGSSVPLPTLKYFNVTCPTLSATQYTIRADGTDSALIGLQLEINEANQRWTRSTPGSWGPVGAPKQCWASKTNGDC